MTSRCTVWRGSDGVQNESDGSDVGYVAVVAGEPFRLGGADRGASGSRVVDTPGGEVAVATRVASFKHDRVLADGDLLEVTAGENAGLFLRVVESTGQDQATARRVQVVEASRPEELA